jgi:hypothetical protein
MKKIFLIFTGLLSMYFSGYSQCGFSVSIEQCCVTVSVIPNAYPRWMIEFGDDHTITSSEVDSTVATHCFGGKPRWSSNPDSVILIEIDLVGVYAGVWLRS